MRLRTIERLHDGLGTPCESRLARAAQAPSVPVGARVSPEAGS
jgi:hypothetical protein